MEAEDGSFEGAIPQNLGADINTAGDDMFPHFRDNGDLYWSTNGTRRFGWTGHLEGRRVEKGSLLLASPKLCPPP